MAQYISKSDLVAEIEKRRNRNSKNQLNLAAAFEDNYLLSFIDTLEVKEVDLESELKHLIGNVGQCDRNIAKHFFELGLNVRQESKV